LFAVRDAANDFHANDEALRFDRDEFVLGLHLRKVANPLEKPKIQFPVNFPLNYCSSLIEHYKIKGFQQQRSVRAFSQKDTSETW
jgi:hypothetical protein